MKKVDKKTKKTNRGINYLGDGVANSEYDEEKSTRKIEKLTRVDKKTKKTNRDINYLVDGVTNSEYDEEKSTRKIEKLTRVDKKTKKTNKDINYLGNGVANSDYDEEKSTRKIEKLTQVDEKTKKIYTCINCDFITYKKYDYERHLSSRKHEKMMLFYKKEQNLYTCENCNRIYNTRQALWKHKKNCEHEIIDLSNNKDLLLTLMKENQSENKLNDNNIVIDKDLFFSIITDNKDFKNMIIEQNKQIIELSSRANSITNTNNNIINTNSNNNNNSFNLNFFLNEQCKDAMNLSDFMDTIDVSLQDLEYVGEHGYINGITKIIIDSLNELDLYKRPIHCTDIKREVIHIKDNGIWEKDNNNEKIKRFIASIGNKNSKLVGIWQKQNPGYALLDSPKYIQWMKLAMHSNEYSKEKRNHEAILHNIIKNVYIDKKESTNIQ